MDRIPQSVAKRVLLSAFLSSDSKTPATGKTIAVVISKNGGAFGNPSGGATNATEISVGWYYVDLSTMDTGTTGPLVIRGTEASIDPTQIQFEVAAATNAGFSGVPAVAAGGNGGLPTVDANNAVKVQSGTGSNQISLSAGLVSLSTPQTFNLTGNITGNLSGSVGSVTGNVGGNVVGSVASVTGNVGGNVVGSVASVVGNVGGNVVGSVASVIAGVVVTTNNDKTGYSLTTGQFQIKKNQALAGFTFPMFNNSTHQMVTGKTVTSQVSIDGAVPVSTTNAVVEVGSGLYKIDLAAADLNGNVIALKFSATNADDLPFTFVTQA